MLMSLSLILKFLEPFGVSFSKIIFEFDMEDNFAMPLWEEILRWFVFYFILGFWIALILLFILKNKKHRIIHAFSASFVFMFY